MDGDRLCDLFPLRDVQLDQNRSPLTDFGSHVDSTMVSIRNATRGCRHGLRLPVANRVSIRQGGCGLARARNKLRFEAIAGQLDGKHGAVAFAAKELHWLAYHLLLAILT